MLGHREDAAADIIPDSAGIRHKESQEGSGVFVAADSRSDRLERGQALFLTCSILSCANIDWNLSQKIKQVRKRGLAPAG